MKRFVDLSVGSLALLFLAPILIAAALSVRLTSPGPVMFRQARQGLDGTEFHIWKFRTMHVGAEKMRAQLGELNETDGPLFKMTDDPRLTSVGSRLRRWSIDELPQLFNVLSGEMSLVGPRPLPTADFADHEAQSERLFVKPGMTGLWQVSGRSTVGWQDMVRLDLEYIDTWSVARDLAILSQTPVAVMRGHGAY